MTRGELADRRQGHHFIASPLIEHGVRRRRRVIKTSLASANQASLFIRNRLGAAFVRKSRLPLKRLYRRATKAASQLAVVSAIGRR